MGTFFRLGGSWAHNTIHVCRHSATRICIIPHRGRLCCSHLHKAGIGWQRRPKARKRHLVLVLHGARQSLLGLDSRERQKVTKAAASRHTARMRELDGGWPYNYKFGVLPPDHVSKETCQE